MNISYYYAVLFVIAYVIAISGLFIIKKKDTKLNAMKWGIISIVTMMCYHTLITSIFKIFGMPFSVPVIILFDFILGSICWYRIIKDKEKQRYSYELFDFIVFIVLVFLTICIVKLEFSYRLEIGYITSDPGVHYGLAMNALRYGETTGMFFAEINNALFISIFAPFLDSLIYCYKIFIAADIIAFLLSGLIFYVIARDYMKSSFTKVAGLIIIILYFLGYPLNNMIFGFVYLGMSVTVIAYLIMLVKMFFEDEINKCLLIPLLGMGCLSLVLCYMLFAPIIWITIFILIGIYRYRKKLLCNKDTIYLMLLIFLIPTIFAIKFSYFDYFVERELDVATVIGNQGGIYKDLLSNFLLLLPFSIYPIITNIRKKKIDIIQIFTISFLIFILIMYYLMHIEVVSSYYYYKLYYPFWLMFMLTVVQGIHEMSKLSKTLIISVSLSLIAIQVGYLYNVKINAVDQEDEVVSSQAYMDIYQFNKTRLIHHGFYDKGLIDLYRYSMDELMPKTQKPIPMYVTLANYEDWYWFESFTGMDSSSFYTWDIGEEKMQEKLLNGDADYVIVNYEDEWYTKSLSFFDNFKIVYQNDKGCIYQLTDI